MYVVAGSEDSDMSGGVIACFFVLARVDVSKKKTWIDWVGTRFGSRPPCSGASDVGELGAVGASTRTNSSGGWLSPFSLFANRAARVLRGRLAARGWDPEVLILALGALVFTVSRSRMGSSRAPAAACRICPTDSFLSRLRRHAVVAAASSSPLRTF
jgi:hypothetical protein